MVLWIKNNLLRILLSVVSLAIAGMYVFYFRGQTDFSNNNPNFFRTLGLRWLEAALIVSLTISAIAFFIAPLFREKGWSEFRMDQKIGIVFGVILYLCLFGLFILQLTDRAIDFYSLLFVLLIVALFVSIIDKLLRLPNWMVELDIIFFFTLLLTYLVAWYPLSNGEADFIVGFHSGAATFQLILINLLFDPKLYINIFKK